jgi:zinc protease
VPGLDVPPLPDPQGLQVKLVSRPDLNQSYVTLGHPGISITHPQMLSTRLMSYALGGSALGSRFGDAVREKGGLAYDVRCWFDRRTLPGAYRATVQTADPALAISKMLDEIRKMHREGPTGQEMASAHNYYTGSFPISYSSSSGKLRHVMEAELHGLGDDWLERFPELVLEQELAELRTAASDRLDPDGFFVVIVGNVTREELELPDAVWLN